jgi:hypothetical protein
MMTVERLDEIEELFIRHPNSPNINDAGRELIAELRERGLVAAEPQPVAADGSPIPTPAPSSEPEQTPTPVSDATPAGEAVAS